MICSEIRLGAIGARKGRNPPPGRGLRAFDQARRRLCNNRSHATLGLPAGVVPSSPSGSDQSEVCP